MTKTDTILQRLLHLHPRSIDLSLGRIERLLQVMGDPHKRLPPVIHVAGTNGKGSVIAYLRAILEASGARVHVYTSPHLVNFRERIRLAGTLVSHRQLNEALESCETQNQGQPITYFEITTAAAFQLFADVPADYLLLEVGLGGRFDATNVIDDPFGTIITPVSIDHVEFLGSEVAGIAKEKAGILKKGAPAVVGRQSDAGLAAIMEEARSLGITPFVAGREFDAFAQNGRLVYQDEDGLLDLPGPNLAGPFQFDNAGIAVAAVRFFGLKASESEIAQGLRATSWPARLMPLVKGRLRAILPPSHELWLDGGHNEAGGGVLAEALREMQIKSPRPLVVVMGAYANKDAMGFLTHFSDLDAEVLTVRIPGERASWSAKDLAGLAAAAELTARPMRSIRGALKAAAATDDARVVICGGLYLAGQVLEQNGTVLD